MKSVFVLVVLIYFGSLPSISVKAFPADGAIEDSLKTFNQTLVEPSGTDRTEYPVFIEEAHQQTTSTESEVVTESYMVIEEQEVDDDEDDESDSSTVSSAIVKTTLPMKSPESSPEQEEVLRELKKLWDYSEGLSDTQDNSALKNSLSSIVHLAYARIYSEPDETLLKLKHLLQKLQARLLGTESNVEDTQDSLLTTTAQSSTFSPTTVSTGASGSPTNLMTATAATRRRKRRSYYDGYEDIESIFFANHVNSAENSVIPGDKPYNHLNNQSFTQNGTNHGDDNSMSAHQNGTMKDPPDRSLLSIGAVSSSTLISISTTPTTPASTMAQKVVHINDRKKPSSPFYLSPERIKELKSRMTSTTTKPSMSATTTSTLPPISIIIDDELENEINSLQQQHQVDNYDVHISLTTPSSQEKTTMTEPTSSTPHSPTTDMPFTAEEIAFALFQLLRPDSESEDDESVTTTSPRPPSNILYQVGSLSSAYNLTKHKNLTTPSSPEAIEDDLNKNPENNSTWLIMPPPALSNLGYTTSSTERLSLTNQGIGDLQAGADDGNLIVVDPSSLSPTKIINGTKESISQMVQALTGLSRGAKMVLLFALSISVLSIGLGVYALGPPLVGVGILGIVIPIGLILLFETGAGKRKLTTRQQQMLINKLNSEEFSKILDLIFSAVAKYSNKG